MKPKADEQKPKKEENKNYEDKLKVKGSFLDIMKASMKDAESKNKRNS
jgi:hypothetical protein